MSLLRFAASRSFTRCASTVSGTVPKKPSNLPYAFLGVGVAGIAGYWYLESKKEISPKQEKSPLDSENFLDFKLKKIIPYNHNTAKFVFELPNNEATLLPVASCVYVRSSDPEALVNEKTGKPVVRPYTPISPSDQKGELTLMVKKYEKGVVSKYIHQLKEGDKLAIKGPIPKFPYQTNEFEQVVLIGGGSGITPLYQLVNHALSDKSNRTNFKLLFSNATEQDILLREEFDDLKKKYPNNFDVVYLVDKPDKSWTGPSGFINADILKQHSPSPSSKEKAKIFVCGPPAQIAAIAGKKDGFKQGELGGILKELGYTEDQVFKF